ncbi:hypothetical protein [Streptomyces sp. WAC06614]|uniref:hypothetical protein n=1 Tax=Streptomyces sp. WAC06614 TaxID=2487416 RepID=UPI000F79DA81|nr:hypothetical protein [Streptomyces sp. WAC06614]RSS69856.1 hypothetical protein EF918_27595 [Streptomyces sp. WAC06614]
MRARLLHDLGTVPCEVGLGVRPEDLPGLVRDGVPVRVYVPYGPRWAAFYRRRLAEAPRPPGT